MKAILIISGWLLFSSVSNAQTSYGDFDFRSFDYHGFSQPYTEYKPQQFKSIGWRSEIKRSPSQGGLVQEIYRRRADGYNQMVQIDYPRTQTGTVYSDVSYAPSTVLVGYAPLTPEIVRGVGYKETALAPKKNIAEYLPRNDRNIASSDSANAQNSLSDSGYKSPVYHEAKQAPLLELKQAVPTHTALWNNSNEPYFSYCMPRVEDANGNGATLCQTVNRAICENVKRNLKNTTAVKTVEIDHAIAVRRQLAMMKKTVNKPPSNDPTPSPELIRACDTFASAFPNTKKQIPENGGPIKMYRATKSLSDK